MIWIVTFCFSGGKFTRYYTTVLPAVLITSALGIQWAGRWLANRIAGFNNASAAVAVIVIAGSVISSVQAAPHFRLFTNSIGGGKQWAGYYFPHDEFYDASMRDVITEIAARARPGARVASESPSLAGYYAERAQRPDLVCISLSDPEALKQLEVGDFIIIARGRRYFSNDAIITTLHDHATPILELKLKISHKRHHGSLLDPFCAFCAFLWLSVLALLQLASRLLSRSLRASLRCLRRRANPIVG
jgi:hypothetical protein